MPWVAVALTQKVRPSGENPLSCPVMPIGSELISTGCRQSALTL